MSACSARNLCVDMAAYPHRAVAAAQAATHVQNDGPGRRNGAGPRLAGLARVIAQP
jgi:hypothetical protein